MRARVTIEIDVLTEDYCGPECPYLGFAGSTGVICLLHRASTGATPLKTRGDHYPQRCNACKEAGAEAMRTAAQALAPDYAKELEP